MSANIGTPPALPGAANLTLLGIAPMAFHGGGNGPNSSAEARTVRWSRSSYSRSQLAEMEADAEIERRIQKERAVRALRPAQRDRGKQQGHFGVLLPWRHLVFTFGQSSSNSQSARINSPPTAIAQPISAGCAFCALKLFRLSAGCVSGHIILPITVRPILAPKYYDTTLVAFGQDVLNRLEQFGGNQRPFGKVRLHTDGQRMRQRVPLVSLSFPGSRYG